MSHEREGEGTVMAVRSWAGPVGVTMTLEVNDLRDQGISQFETHFKKNRCFAFSCVWLKKEK